MRYTQSPFGWSKLEPSALAWLSKGYGIELGMLLLRQGRQSCVGVVFTLFDPTSCVVVVQRKLVWQWMTAG